ncbi:cation diffusion facilitator family transporter [Glycomyces sp. NRRL B-16210]|uniref:cation diffusion facilitator family transporter n=1 Tax=Glycomyces sp. NRRL B-16210 TaxID=1463821 RepID=UPI00068CDE80|nr:cation diffusion facilitator family transporter [Glycomyces sp. NRRL B-16210]
MGHAHDHAPGHAGGRHAWRLRAALAVIGAFFVVELVFGLLSGSLALLSDAGHMAADVITLSAALVATRLATRPDTTGRRTYGSYRAEMFASGFAVLIMLGMAVYIVIEAVGRIGSEPEIQVGPMLVVGALGLGANIAAMLLLRSGADESLNVKGAYLEVVADTAGSVGVIIAGIMVAVTGQAAWDTGVALAIGVFIVARALPLGRQVLAILAQHAPPGIEPAKVADDLAAIPGVREVHDVHLWTLTSGMHVATAHLVTEPGTDDHAALDRAQHLLREDWGITHATVQVEPADHADCDEPGRCPPPTTTGTNSVSAQGN